VGRQFGPARLVAPNAGRSARTRTSQAHSPKRRCADFKHIVTGGDDLEQRLGSSVDLAQPRNERSARTGEVRHRQSDMDPGVGFDFTGEHTPLPMPGFGAAESVGEIYFGVVAPRLPIAPTRRRSIDLVTRRRWRGQIAGREMARGPCAADPHTFGSGFGMHNPTRDKSAAALGGPRRAGGQLTPDQMAETPQPAQQSEVRGQSRMSRPERRADRHRLAVLPQPVGRRWDAFAVCGAGTALGSACSQEVATGLGSTTPWRF